MEREEDRIDILLKSSDKKKAIIIENKSNNADDQPKQLLRYYNKLKDDNIIVEAIFYLNKTSSTKKPDFHGLEEKEKNELMKLLVVGNLIDEEDKFTENIIKKDSFTENVIKNVIQKTNNIRLNALSQEIMDLFKSVIDEGLNMKDLDNFVKELSDNNNLQKLQNAIKEYKKIIKKFGKELSDDVIIEKLQKTIEAYNDLPKYFVKKYLKYLDSKKTGYKVWEYRNTTLVIDNIKTETGINYAIDVRFSLNNISFGLFVRDKSEEECIKILKKLKKDTVGDVFPFKAPLDGRRYKRYIENIFDDISIKKLFDELIEFVRKYIV